MRSDISKYLVLARFKRKQQRVFLIEFESENTLHNFSLLHGNFSSLDKLGKSFYSQREMFLILFPFHSQVESIRACCTCLKMFIMRVRNEMSGGKGIRVRTFKFNLKISLKVKIFHRCRGKFIGTKQRKPKIAHTLFAN